MPSGAHGIDPCRADSAHRQFDQVVLCLPDLPRIAHPDPQVDQPKLVEMNARAAADVEVISPDK